VASVVEYMTFYEIIKDPFTPIGIHINSDEFVSHRIHFGFGFLSLKYEDRYKTQPYGLIDDK